jgi:hypothetical protein
MTQNDANFKALVIANNYTAIDFQRFYDAMTQNKIKKII